MVFLYKKSPIDFSDDIVHYMDNDTVYEVCNIDMYTYNLWTKEIDKNFLKRKEIKMAETLKEQLITELTKLYTEQNPDNKDYQLYIDNAIPVYDIFDALTMKLVYQKIKIKSIDKIHTDLFSPIIVSLRPEENNKKSYITKVETGIFKVSLTNGITLFIAVYQIGSSETIYGLLIGTKEETSILNNILKRSDDVKFAKQVPKKGTYILKQDEMGRLVYEKLKQKSVIPTIHPTIEKLRLDITNFYKNIGRFTRFNMPGVRKSMLVGPPGTGKTSILQLLAKEYDHEIPVVFGMDIATIAQHLNACAKLKRKTLVFLEDAEGSLGEHEVERRGSSTVLNFLDGVNLKQNIHGSYVILTTNYPEKIENRIKKRPGRIDKIFEVHALTDEFAYECAKIYFPPELFSESHGWHNELKHIFSKMTGAQIKELSNSAMSYLVGEDINDELTPKIINTVKKEMAESYQKLDKFAKDTTEMSGNNSGNFGFGGDDD